MTEKPHYDKREQKVVIDKVLDEREYEDHGHESKEFLVKWGGKAHIYNSWISERRLQVHNAVKLNNFLEKDEEDKKKDLDFLPSWRKPERIVDAKG